MSQFRRPKAGDSGIDVSQPEKLKTSDSGFEALQGRLFAANDPETPVQQYGELTIGGSGMPPQQFNGPMPGGSGMPSQQYNGPMSGGPGAPPQQFNGPMSGGPGAPPQQYNGPVPSGPGAPPQQFNGPVPSGPGAPPQQYGRPPKLNNRVTDTPPPSPMVNRGGGQPSNNHPYGAADLVSMSKQPRNRTMTILASVCVAAVVFAGLFFVYNNLKTPSVVLYQAKKQTVPRTVGGSGIIYPSTELPISFPNVERVSKVDVKPGDTVKNQQPLVTLDLSQMDASISQASANVAAAQLFLASVAGGPQGPAAQERLAQATNAYNALVAEKNSPLLNNGSLIAPYDAVVTAVNVNPGEVAAANVPLVVLQVQSIVVDHVEIPLAYYQEVYVTQTATVTPSTSPDKNFTGTVISKIPQASQNADTFEVWISLPNDKQQGLLPGMSTAAVLQESVTAIVIPRLAVLNPDQNPTVFVVRNSHAYEKRIQVAGYTTGNNVIVDPSPGGIVDGDTVVVTGVDALHDGQVVKVTSVEQSTP